MKSGELTPSHVHSPSQYVRSGPNQLPSKSDLNSHSETTLKRGSPPQTNVRPAQTNVRPTNVFSGNEISELFVRDELDSSSVAVTELLQGDGRAVESPKKGSSSPKSSAKKPSSPKRKAGAKTKHHGKMKKTGSGSADSTGGVAEEAPSPHHSKHKNPHGGGHHGGHQHGGHGPHRAGGHGHQHAPHQQPFAQPNRRLSPTPQLPMTTPYLSGEKSHTDIHVRRSDGGKLNPPVVDVLSPPPSPPPSPSGLTGAGPRLRPLSHDAALTRKFSASWDNGCRTLLGRTCRHSLVGLS